MVPVVMDAPSSFKPAALYYLHDKRREGETERLTTDRIAWVETVNLSTQDPEQAWRIMACTALAQSELKRRSGQALSGRQLTKPAFAYSLSWHENDKPTRDEQRAAAHETLEVLGFNGLQAMIICHNDTKHPHVHIMVNRVHPETGIAAKVFQSKKKLQAWALAYERARGQTHCPAREANAKRREQGLRPKPNPRISRPKFEFNQATGNSLSADFIKTDQKQKDAKLFEFGRQLRAMQQRQWPDLKRVYDAERERIKKKTAADKAAAALKIKTESKERWRAIFRTQRINREAFDRQERSALGKTVNFFIAFRELKRQNRHHDAMVIFLTLFSSSQRRAALLAEQENNRRALASRIKKDIGDAARIIGRDALVDYDQARAIYLRRCEELRHKQEQQRLKMREAWRIRNKERRDAITPFLARGKRRTRKGGRSIEDDARYKPRRRRNRDPFGPSP